MTLLFFVAILSVTCQLAAEEKVTIVNPITEKYLQEHLRKDMPRLVINTEMEKAFRNKIKNDPVTRNMYAAIKLNAQEICQKPLLTRKKEGRRLLAVSRKMLYRMNMLAMAYLVDKDPKILERINQELVAVCKFSDWNPSHFLDVAEMSLAVALALDWTAGALPKETIDLAQQALIDKGIKPSWEKKPGWVNGTNNWNQVCNGGMIAASLVIAERDPKLAAKTIRRSLDGIPRALAEYTPHGVYPEGATYWSYGTSFTVITIAMLRSALGDDFGIPKAPGFMNSAVFRTLACSKSDQYFNFSDCGTKRGSKGDVTLAWFGTETGNKCLFETERFLIPAEDMGKLPRLGGAALVWISQYEQKKEERAPAAWHGDGANPVVFFVGDDNDPRSYYFGAKGGRGSVNHGNMDAGTFVFELDGVRWVMDPGNQSYHELEKVGFKLWGRNQNSDRWKLLTKNNFGHSTLSVDGRLHKVDGKAEIVGFKIKPQPEVTIDLGPAFSGQLKSAKRTFCKDSPASLLITDDIELDKKTKQVVWQLMTTARVTITKAGATLSKDGKKLRIGNLSHPDIPFEIVSLNPPPHELDRKINGLKRLELRLPASACKDGKARIQVRLQGVD